MSKEQSKIKMRIEDFTKEEIIEVLKKYEFFWSDRMKHFIENLISYRFDKQSEILLKRMDELRKENDKMNFKDCRTLEQQCKYLKLREKHYKEFTTVNKKFENLLNWHERAEA